MATAMVLEVDSVADVQPAAAGTPAARQRRGWFRRAYSPVEAEEEECTKDCKKPRRGWLKRLVSRECALGRRRWKLSGAAVPSRLAAGLRWKRVSVASRLGYKAGCASAMLDAVAFRVMYVVEAVVLGLALSCFFCCCGCQI